MTKPKQPRVTCRRCACRYTARPAISRTDNHTPICPGCGNAEAVQQHRGTLTPQDRWAMLPPLPAEYRSR